MLAIVNMTKKKMNLESFYPHLLIVDHLLLILLRSIVFNYRPIIPGKKRATFPIAAAPATEEPLNAAKPAHAPMVAIPNPPGNFLNHLSKV